MKCKDCLNYSVCSDPDKGASICDAYEAREKRIYRKKHTCCICGKKFQEWPNDPWPVNMDDNAECCDACNWQVVMPARIAQMERKESC